jgi:SnoaL-like domain
MDTSEHILRRAYDAFNARDISAALTLMHPQVDWPNGMEGGRVLGRDAVREYWTRQWKMVDPHVDPLAFSNDAAGRTIVDVHQVVRNLDGNVLLDRMVKHSYLVESGLIRSMEIDESEGTK